jgi:3-dehydroquinate synthase
MTTAVRTVSVRLAERSYDVLVGPGLLDDAGARLAPLLKRPRLPVVADSEVARLHGPRLQAGLTRSGVEAQFITVPPGEGSKSFAELERVLDALVALRLDRSEPIAAFGGGVVGDLAGFAAAIHKRGAPFIQMPTTLLSQVDSSVGGKTAIDTPRGKNLIGAFHQPRLVLADTDVLSTLPPRELRAGLAEVIKAGLIEDPDLFAWLEANAPAVLALEPEALTTAVVRAVEFKAGIVAEDEYETTGRRALLNLGHTFGHALEAEDWRPLDPPLRSGGGGSPPSGETEGALHPILHGEAVALGCALALRFSAQQGFCSLEDVQRTETLLARCGLLTRLSDLPARYTADRLLDRMADDKKNTGGLTLILARGIGRAFLAPNTPPALVRDFLITQGAQP